MAKGVKTEFQQLRAGYGASLAPNLRLVGTVGRDMHVSGGFKQDLVAQLRVLKLF